VTLLTMVASSTGGGVEGEWSPRLRQHRLLGGTGYLGTAIKRNNETGRWLLPIRAGQRRCGFMKSVWECLHPASGQLLTAQKHDELLIASPAGNTSMMPSQAASAQVHVKPTVCV
jgi:hypothetical protein